MLRGTMISVALIAVLSAASLAAIVNFPDPGLEAVIREAIGRPSGGIYDYQLEDLEILEASKRGISDLEGLQYYQGIIELDLSANAIANINILSHLTELEILNLTDNQIVDLRPLSNLSCVRILRLGNNAIVALGPLAALAETDLQADVLKELELDRNKIVDVASLAGIASLQKLVLGCNQILDIAPLAGLTNLASFSLVDNQIVTIGALADLIELKILLLYNNQISDISPLSGLEDLLGLWLSGNPIANLQPLVDNPGLDFGDRIYICGDQLDLNPGSLAAQHIMLLARRGVYVYECL